MAELLLEIFSGEIPARMQEDARYRFENSLVSAVRDVFSGEISVKSWITPRRLGLVIEGFKLELITGPQELRGPRIGAPTQALEGFLKKNNLHYEQLEKRGDYYFTVIKSTEGDPVATLKHIIVETIKNFVWPKSMIDGDHSLRWVRPIKSILCLLDGGVLDFSYHHIKSGNTTYGHRLMAPEAVIVNSYADYVVKLGKAYVMLEAETRRNSIKKQVSEKLSGKKVMLIEDEELMSEIVGLVEHPRVFIDEIDPNFMSLPREVLIITLKNHQRYLMTEETNGSLAPYYLIVANIEPEDEGKALINGNQKVLAARLSDAKFFYELDLKAPLESRIEQLKNLTFHADIGSICDKQKNVETLAHKLALMLNLDAKKMIRAIELSKCDLTSNMVKEFPELQGVMGYHYALACGEHEQVAIAIRDHYKPQGPHDRLPEGSIASAVALADKLDTLNQMFAIGIRPTGSKDPFALRRAAIGVLRIIMDNNFAIDLKDLGIRPDVIEFIQERLDVMLKNGEVAKSPW
jgi:glycyl-tRNA synthetase beta chain